MAIPIFPIFNMHIPGPSTIPSPRPARLPTVLRPGSSSSATDSKPSSSSTAGVHESRYMAAEFDLADRAQDGHEAYTGYDPHFGAPLERGSRAKEMLYTGHSRAASASAESFGEKAPLTSMPVAKKASDGPSWPWISRLVVRVVILALSATVLALSVGSLGHYLRTRAMLLPDADEGMVRAWPEDISILPLAYTLGVACASVVASLCFVVLGSRRTGLGIASLTVALLLGVWAGAIALYKTYSRADYGSIAWWACGSKHPASENGVVDYEGVCREQKAAHNLTSVLAAAELLVLLSFAHSFFVARRQRRGAWPTYESAPGGRV
ncbi:MAG: hypothetical protein M1832_005496 [Thelocarpon impressellum]|nr:MAG: hypothetical protein M1832_005496 [Thelocarpon impressellum]